MELIIDFDSLKDPAKKEWLLRTLKLMGIGFQEAVSKVKVRSSTPNNILFFLNLSGLCDFFVSIVVKNQPLWALRVQKEHYDKI